MTRVEIGGALAVLALGACGACGSSREESYRYATACQVGQDRRPDAGIRLAQAFPALEPFAMPIDLTHFHDGSKRIAVAERDGRIRVIHPSADGRPRVTTALDISARVYTGFECGFLGLATHPAHAENRKLYTHYCIKPAGETVSVISEWTMRADDRDTVDPDSERVLIEVDQPWDNHNGGALAFGPEGLLYIGFGDGGGGNDPLGSGQDCSSLLGKILRIDPLAGLAPGDGRAYGIPADNPFAATAEGRPEIFAWGLRNPWRFSFDRVTGALWVGDVGQDHVEEIDIVEHGKNYGWNIMEGSRCRPGGPEDCARDGLVGPVVEYDHDIGRSVTGGYVYRGAAVPALVGRYVYADFATRVVFSWRAGEPAPEAPLLVAEGAIVSFGEDEDGELYALDLEGGRLFRFEQGMGSTPSPPPATLSATKCFGDLATLAPAEGVEPYDIALPFWSDGASKQRFLVLPEGGQITPSETGAYRLPVGSVLIKHFALASPDGTERRLETRFLIQEELGVRGFSYRWDEDGADAKLALDGARFPVEGPAGAHDWHLPSGNDCAACHRGRGVLGLEARQLGPRAQGLWALGLMSAAPAEVPTLATPDGNGTLEDKARAWLHVNCGYCHDGLGPSGTPLDLRLDASLEDMAACGATPLRGDMGIEGAQLIAAGDPERSVLWHRMSVRDVHGMPPLATAVVDPQSRLVHDWIASLDACPEE